MGRALVCALLVAITVTLACGEEGEQLPEDVATATADSTGTPDPEKSPVTAAPSPGVTTTTATSTPSPEGGQAPDRCIADKEKAYLDPDGKFAFCYPSDLSVHISEAVACCGQGVSILDGEPGKQVLEVNAIWTRPVPPEFASSEARCSEQIAIHESRNEQLLTPVIDQAEATACQQDVYDKDSGVYLLRRTDYLFPLESGGAIEVSGSYSIDRQSAVSDSRRAIVERIVGSLSVN